MLHLFVRLFKRLFIGPAPDRLGVMAPPLSGAPRSNGVHAPDPAPARPASRFILIPNNGRLVVERMELEKVSAGGIVYPETMDREKNVRVYVYAVSDPWIDESGRDRVSKYRPGDYLLISRYAGEEVVLDQGKLKITLVRENDVLGKINLAGDADHVPDAVSQPPPRQEADLRYEAERERRERYDLADSANR